MFFNKKDGDVEGQARDGDARLRVVIPLAPVPACLDAARRLGDHRVSCRVPRARRCSRRTRELRLEIAVVVDFVRATDETDTARPKV